MLLELAAARRVILVEAVKTAFAPGFQRMVAVARIGTIGTVRSVDATFTKLVTEGRELHGHADHGKGREGGQHPGEVRGAAGAGNDHLDAPPLGAGSKLGHPHRRAMR